MSTSDTSKQVNLSSEEIAQQFLTKASSYFQSEVRLVAADYDCLNKMNDVALDKYKQMGRTLERVNTSVRSMNESNRSNVLSTSTQFEDIEEAMTNLETTIKNLDAYSRSLESQVKKYEKTAAANRKARRE